MATIHDGFNTFLVHAQLCGCRKLEMVLRWPCHITIDVLYMLLVDKVSGTSTNIFLNPTENEFISPLDFHPDSSKYAIHVYGLVTRETENGRFYQLVGYSRRKLKVGDTDKSDVTVTFNIKEDLTVKLPLKDDPEKILDVTIRRCPPASYTILAEPNSDQLFTFVIFLKQLHQIFVFILNTKKLKFSLPLELQSGTWSKIQLLCASQLDGSTNKNMIARTIYHSEKIPFKTYLSVDDSSKLYCLALSYVGNNDKSRCKIKPIKHFYRNKCEKYYKDIETSASGIMKPYLKDYNGDQGCLINGAIPGLFYSTILGSKSKPLPMPISFYGRVRLHIQANVLFTEICNVYFSDFYCHYTQHYVTIVLTPQGSPADNFCHQYLLKLDKYDNPFLKIVRSTNGSHCIMANMAVVVEVFYTESVNIINLLENGYGYMSKTILMGRGESKPDGIPKNENCKKCNLS